MSYSLCVLLVRSFCRLIFDLLCDMQQLGLALSLLTSPLQPLDAEMIEKSVILATVLTDFAEAFVVQNELSQVHAVALLNFQEFFLSAECCPTYAVFKFAEFINFTSSSVK